jgi:sugar phosphate isomerase/epimerase
MPRLAAFPKAFLDALCVDGSMTIAQWLELARTLDIDGLEFYAGFLELKDEASCRKARRDADDVGLPISMLCCSPDFTHPDKAFRRQQIDQEKQWIDFAGALGAQYCRVLSGQRRPEVSRHEGIRVTVDCIEECLAHAAQHGITLVIENHYKDNYWTYAEFAQKMDVFCELVSEIDAPNFGVNYDPSNTLLAGEDPLKLLQRIKHRVVTMHASDRYLAEGTLDDLRREENEVGYARRLRHGEIGKGLNDYDAIFGMLAGVGFDGWISIEDGVDGMDQLRSSARFLREKIQRYWLTER